MNKDVIYNKMLDALEKIASCFDENGELCETTHDQLSVALEAVDKSIKDAKDIEIK